METLLSGLGAVISLGWWDLVSVSLRMVRDSEQIPPP